MSKKTIIILANLLISIILVFVFIDPLWSSVKGLRTDTDEQNQEIEKIEGLFVKIKELEKGYQEAGGEDMQSIIFALPKEKDLPYLITQFESLASNNGLLLGSLTFGNEINREKDNQDNLPSQKKKTQKKDSISLFPYLSVEISLNGSYEGLKSYLEDIENNIRLMEVREINFKEEQGDSEIELASPIFKFTLNLIVYYQ